MFFSRFFRLFFDFFRLFLPFFWCFLTPHIFFGSNAHYPRNRSKNGKKTVLAQLVGKMCTRKWQKCRSGVTIYRYEIGRAREEVGKGRNRVRKLVLGQNRPKQAKTGQNSVLTGGTLVMSLSAWVFRLLPPHPGGFFRLFLAFFWRFFRLFLGIKKVSGSGGQNLTIFWSFFW